MAYYSNGEDTKNIIIRAADKLFWEKGYASTTFEDICRLAHVKRSTINYHFKTKNHILWHCKRYTYEKTVMAASCYCNEPDYLYILSESIYWYYILNDAAFFRMATEYARLELIKYNARDNRYDKLITCYLPALSAAGMEVPEQLPLTEVTLRGLVQAPFLLGESIEEKSLQELMENYMYIVGRICGLPKDIIHRTIQEVQKRMEKIPYDSLHLHWP